MDDLHLTYQFSAMGTTAEIIASGLGLRTVEASADVVHELERRWSRFLAGSEIATLNRKSQEALQAGSTCRPVLLSDETFQLIAMAIDAWQQSGGAFDPTIGGSMHAAGYDRSFELIDGPDLPISAAGTIRNSHSHRPAPGPSGIELDDVVKTITVPPGVALDLGGIAKGLAADHLAQYLINVGATGCCVNIGGDLRAMGAPPRPEGWQIALDCPGAQRTRHIGLRAGAICTTSKSKRRWASDAPGGVEHHLRDPKTGASFETGVTSVTVIAARASQAEVLCKMAFAAGLERGPTVLTDHGATGLMVADDGTTIEVAGFWEYGAAALGPAGIPAASSSLVGAPLASAVGVG